MNARAFTRGLLAGAALLYASLAGAQQLSSGRSGIPPAIPEFQLRAEGSVALGSIESSAVYSRASVATGGIGLRNLGEGGIEISGARGPIKVGFLYWTVISQGPPPDAAKRLLIRRPGGGGDFTEVVGRVVGSGDSPCWNQGDRIVVFRGRLPPRIATGNGHYRIEIPAGGTGSRNGEDPFVTSPAPMINGASVVIIGTGTSTVALYDAGLAGHSFHTSLRYSLKLGQNVGSASQVLFYNIGSDGQTGESIDAFRQTSAEVTSIGDGSGVRIAGPGSEASDSDWNGGVGKPLPQLWDNTAHDITKAAEKASIGTALPVRISAPRDCLTPVANIVAIRD